MQIKWQFLVQKLIDIKPRLLGLF